LIRKKGQKKRTVNITDRALQQKLKPSQVGLRKKGKKVEHQAVLGPAGGGGTVDLRQKRKPAPPKDQRREARYRKEGRFNMKRGPLVSKAPVW